MPVACFPVFGYNNPYIYICLCLFLDSINRSTDQVTGHGLICFLRGKERRYIRYMYKYNEDGKRGERERELRCDWQHACVSICLAFGSRREGERGRRMFWSSSLFSSPWNMELFSYIDGPSVLTGDFPSSFSSKSGCICMLLLFLYPIGIDLFACSRCIQ